MASYQDLLDAIARVGAATGDSKAWLSGLSDADLAVVTSPASVVAPSAIDNVLTKIRAGHRQAFDPSASVAAEGRAAEAIRTAETSLAQQNSVSAHLDLQVITAVLNAHATHAAGWEALDRLQNEIESAVATRTDLDTPAGARAFQRYLIDKLRDIKTVVETAGLDDTSKASLAAALASLYAGATPATADEHPPESKPTESAKPPGPAEAQLPVTDIPADLGTDPFADELLPDGLAPPPDPSTAGQPMAAPMIPPMAGIPALGGSSPATGPAPISSPLGDPAPMRLPTQDSLLDDPMLDEPVDEEPGDPDAGEDDDAVGEDVAEPPPPDDSTVVHLPNGETVTASSSQLAAAITAAVAGTPIPEAFRQQGITIPAPGTAVAHPVDPAGLIPGDIGMLMDRHALALGNGKAVFNNQIQPIASVTGPSFLGWEHPPEPGDKTTPRSAQQTQANQPTPTRPAVTAGPPAIGE
ncbi:DUF4226 domain-containing protein [Mycolicibacterium sphagni]|uniref:DUF4226 domain-containing protein n=1 Tax=Mycolicibacterium sphagni TaxID=1786 RepID=A0A255DNZ7_9MYCO|nr:DUF4226 domain-containing protein [Mycolicibacterium sphagni]OYN78955.1 hypothetical protein CG716_13910 [Mycolicibacterium sphagni]